MIFLFIHSYLYLIFNKFFPEICIFNRMCLKAGVQIQMNRSKLLDYDSAYIMQLNEAAHAIDKYLEEMGDGE